MTHSAEGQRNRSNAGLSGGLSWQLTASDVISLAINVIQNRLDRRKLRPDLAHLLGGSAAKQRGRGQGGDGPASDALRMMLEKLYREIVRANGLGAARAIAGSVEEEYSEPGKRPQF